MTAHEASATSASVVVPENTSSASPDQPVTTAKVLVVDDELHGLTTAHLRQYAPEFVAELNDTNSPTVEALWSLSSAMLGHPAIDDVTVDEIRNRLSSDGFVTDFVLSDQFKNSGAPGVDKLGVFYQRHKEICELKKQIEEAFPGPSFDLTFVAARPSVSRTLLDFRLVILDLVLAGSGAPVDELIKYLSDLGAETYPAALPLFIVLSSSDELIGQRLRFSAGSNISAAGMLLLHKPQIRVPTFGSRGIGLSYQQLEAQREIAQHMRRFMWEWTSALDRAKDGAKTTLWNLDASAMQEIHLGAFNDDDPYDEHLNDLVAREYLWHVEKSGEVASAIEALDGCFQSKLRAGATSAALAVRFNAPFVDSEPPRLSRRLVGVSHAALAYSGIVE